MTTQVIDLDDEAREVLHDILKSAYLDGECYAFAIGLKRGLGWSMVGLIDGKGEIRHAMVCGPDNRLYDARGSFDQDDPLLGEPFGLAPPYTQRPVKETDLYNVRPVHSRTISQARRLAEIVWPEYPWKGGQRTRVIAFLDELSELCRKHEVWIRAPLPAMTSWPLIGKMHGDEAGFIVRPTDDGMAFVFDRQLRKNEH